MTKGELNNMLNDLIQAAYDTGYLAASIEKTAALPFSPDRRAENERQQREKIYKRQQARQKILDALF